MRAFFNLTNTLIETYSLKQRGDSMQRFTFDDEDDSIKDTKRENSIQQEEKEPEVKKVVKTKVKQEITFFT